MSEFQANYTGAEMNALWDKADKSIQGVKVNGTELPKDAANKVDITITKEAINLGNVDNTADANKPVSAPQMTAIATAIFEETQMRHTEITQAVAAEASARDAAIETAVDEEAQARETAIAQAVEAEADARDAAIETAVDAEATQRAAAITAAALAEAEARDEAIEAAIAQEVIDRNAAISGTVDGKIDKVANPTLGNIAVLTSTGGVSDSGKNLEGLADTSELGAEQNAREAGDLELTRALASEQEAREAAEEALGDRIDTEAEARAAAVTEEATAREAADTALAGDIEAEASARATAISSEAAAREAADTAEATARAAAVTAEATARQSADTNLNNTKANKDGYYQTLSAGYADRAGDLDIQTSVMVRHNQTKAMETTGGDKDVKDGTGFIRVVRGTADGLEALRVNISSLGFNLIPPGSGTSFSFRCVKGEWGAYGTSQKNNGYLFSDSQGNVLIPVSVKQNGVDVPTHTDHGNTYYLPSQDGQCTVVFATSQTNPCAHLCWSNGRDTKDNYEEYFLSNVDITSEISAMGGVLRRVGYVFDEVNLETKQNIRRIGHRLLKDLSWTMEAGPTPEEGEATNTFRAIVSGGIATTDTIKAGGAFIVNVSSSTTLTFSLDGTSLVCESTIASVADFVTAITAFTIWYELAVEVVTSNSLNGQITISDYGIIYIMSHEVVDIDFDFDTKWRDFIKNLPDDLEQMRDETDSVKKEVASIHEDIDGIRDTTALPLLCGQPPVLFGAGAPAEAVVPDNWKQFDPATGEGYNWNGNPSAIGQRYINVSATNGGYTAGRKSLDKASADYYVLKWYKD